MSDNSEGALQFSLYLTFANTRLSGNGQRLRVANEYMVNLSAI